MQLEKNSQAVFQQVDNRKLQWPTSVTAKLYWNNRAKTFTAKVLKKLQNITNISADTTRLRFCKCQSKSCCKQQGKKFCQNQGKIFTNITAKVSAIITAKAFANLTGKVFPNITAKVSASTMANVLINIYYGKSLPNNAAKVCQNIAAKVYGNSTAKARHLATEVHCVAEVNIALGDQGFVKV